MVPAAGRLHGAGETAQRGARSLHLITAATNESERPRTGSPRVNDLQASGGRRAAGAGAAMGAARRLAVHNASGDPAAQTRRYPAPARDSSRGGAAPPSSRDKTRSRYSRSGIRQQAPLSPSGPGNPATASYVNPTRVAL